MPDVPSAALGLAACYCFWRWLRRPAWGNALFVGVLLGIAQLTKSTLVIFFILWPLAWICYRISEKVSVTRFLLRESGMVAAQLVVALYVLNLGYFFEGTFAQLKEYQFRSHLFTGAMEDDRAFLPGNRFANGSLGLFPIPFPSNYLQGIDAQRMDFEHGLPSYLGGAWRDHGWWYFYLYGLCTKMPLGTWVLVFLAAAAPFWLAEPLASLRDELYLFVPAATIFGLVSSQCGFSIHFRYAIPALPFVYVFASKCALIFNSNNRRMAGVVALAFAWSVGASVWQFPHSLSYSAL